MTSTVFGLPCEKAPSLREIYFSTGLSPFSAFLKSIFLNPDESMSKRKRFFYSKFFLTLYLWYVVFRVPREFSRTLSQGFGINFALLMLINTFFVFELFRRYGYECTFFLVVLLYLFYHGVISMVVPMLAQSPVGDAIPQLKEIPAASRKPGTNHCRRLLLCRMTPVFDNYKFQKGKYEKCLECAEKDERIVFNSEKDNCESTKRDVDAKSCYECTENNPPDVDCTYDDEDCEKVNMVLDLLDPITTHGVQKYDRTTACKSGHGSLCWFGKLPGGQYRGWNFKQGDIGYRTFDPSDSKSSGHGFPSKHVCEQEMGSTDDGICVRGVCDVSAKKKECICEQYKDVSQFENPCEFLEEHCDENSLAFKEAQIKINQTNVNVDDIVSVKDVGKFLNQIDNVASAIP